MTSSTTSRTARARAAASVLAMAGIAVGCLMLLGPTAGQAQTLPPLPLTTTTTAPRPSTTAPPTTQPPPPTTTPPPIITAPPSTAAVPSTVDTVFTPAVPPSLVLPVPLPPTSVARPSASTTTPVVVSRVVRVRQISASAVSGAYGIGVAGTLLLTFLIIALAAMAKAARYTVAPAHPGGSPMDRTLARTRLYVGFGCIAVAGIVAVAGYLGLSRNPDVNRQIPYLASAGMAVVILAAVGGAFIVAEQLRNDDRRIAELEDALRQLAVAVAPAIEAPARLGRQARSSASGGPVPVEVSGDAAPGDSPARASVTPAPGDPPARASVTPAPGTSRRRRAATR